MVSHAENNRTGGCESDLRRLWTAEQQLLAATSAAAASAGSGSGGDAHHVHKHRVRGATHPFGLVGGGAAGQAGHGARTPRLDVTYFTDDAAVHARRYGPGSSGVARPGDGDDIFWRELPLHRPEVMPPPPRSAVSTPAGAEAAQDAGRSPTGVPPIWHQIWRLLVAENRQRGASGPAPAPVREGG
jgi:hypothetical protein